MTIYTFTGKGTTMTQIMPPCDVEQLTPLERKMTNFKRAVSDLLEHPVSETARYREFGRGFNTLVEDEIRRLETRKTWNTDHLARTKRCPVCHCQSTERS